MSGTKQLRLQTKLFVRKDFAAAVMCLTGRGQSIESSLKYGLERLKGREVCLIRVSGVRGLRSGTCCNFGHAPSGSCLNMKSDPVHFPVCAFRVSLSDKTFPRWGRLVYQGRLI